VVDKEPILNYVLEVLMQFKSGADQVVIRGKGKNIPKVVDVAEITKADSY